MPDPASAASPDSSPAPALNPRSAAPGPRGRRWPLVLAALALGTLILGVVAMAELYWSELHRGVEQMRASVARAQQEQQRLITRLRQAEARQPVQAPAVTGATSDTGPGPEVPMVPMISLAGQPLRDTLPRPERDALGRRLEALGREAARLPGAFAGSMPGLDAKQLLRNQLRTAGIAAAAGDVPLIAASLFAAERLCGPPYRTMDGRARRLRTELLGLRRGLLRSPASAGSAAATVQPLRPQPQPVAPAPHPAAER